MESIHDLQCEKRQKGISSLLLQSQLKVTCLMFFFLLHNVEAAFWILCAHPYKHYVHEPITCIELCRAHCGSTFMAHKSKCTFQPCLAHGKLCAVCCPLHSVYAAATTECCNQPSLHCLLAENWALTGLCDYVHSSPSSTSVSHECHALLNCKKCASGSLVALDFSKYPPVCAGLKTILH